MIFVTNLKEWYRLPTNKKEGIIFTTLMCFLMVLGMSAYNLCLMVLGMVTCMSLFGVIMEQGIPDQLFSAYMNAWKMNVIAALPLQLIIVGPLSRSVLKAIQSNE